MNETLESRGQKLETAVDLSIANDFTIHQEPTLFSQYESTPSYGSFDFGDVPSKLVKLTK